MGKESMKKKIENKKSTAIEEQKLKMYKIIYRNYLYIYNLKINQQESKI